MSIPVNTECLQCYLKRNLELVRPLGTEEKAMAFAKQLMQHYIDAPAGVSSPWFSPKVADLLHEMYDLPIDRFRQEKLESNRFVMERFDTISSIAQSAEDPVLAGLQLAILGNYMDFSALQDQVSFEKLEEMLREALHMPLDMEV